MAGAVIFGDGISQIIDDFDSRLRSNLLSAYRDLGPLKKTKMSKHEAEEKIGKTFYAVFEGLVKETNLLARARELLKIGLPDDFDEVSVILDRKNIPLLERIILLLLFINDYPYRAFFSGKLTKLPVNALELHFKYDNNTGIVSNVSYKLKNVRLVGKGKRESDRNEWKIIVYVWYF